jgi:hypothetical protein
MNTRDWSLSTCSELTYTNIASPALDEHMARSQYGGRLVNAAASKPSLSFLAEFMADEMLKTHLFVENPGYFEG